MTRRLALLVNPTSGKGRGAPAGGPGRRTAAAAGFDVEWSSGRDADEAARPVRAAVAAGVDALVAVGGDGMVHLALQVVAGTDVPLGIVPAGTGNDIARAARPAAGTTRCAAVDRRSPAGSRARVDAGRAERRAGSPGSSAPASTRRSTSAPTG